MRERLADGAVQADLARSYGVSEATISRLAAASPFEHGAVGGLSSEIREIGVQLSRVQLPRRAHPRRTAPSTYRIGFVGWLLHRANIPLIKYLSEGREMEIALAPIAGTRLLAPFRLSAVSTLANLMIEANRFETIMAPAR